MEPGRPHLRDDGIPTRCDTTRMSDAEIAITAAMHAVEGAGASPAMTDAVALLGKARDRVADHVEARACPDCGSINTQTMPARCLDCGFGP
jgi:hypothetical protein